MGRVYIMWCKPEYRGLLVTRLETVLLWSNKVERVLCLRFILGVGVGLRDGICGKRKW